MAESIETYTAGTNGAAAQWNLTRRTAEGAGRMCTPKPERDKDKPMYYYFYPEESEETLEYQTFVNKFKPKKTTDDCYTPPLIYETVKDWACKKYGIDPAKTVRPFYPGGDYESFDYSGGAVVLDNPPFSILTKICEFYLARDIPFFLFAPALTCFGGRSTAMRITHILCDGNIEYENGAIVRTAFVTNLGGDIIAQTAPDLMEAIEAASAELKREKGREIPKYEYPDNILTAAMLKRYCKYKIPFTVSRQDCAHISAMDEQKSHGKAIFGSGLLLSERAAAERAAAERAAAERAAAERAAAERAAAERAAAHVWKLSEREKKIVAGLGKD